MHDERHRRDDDEQDDVRDDRAREIVGGGEAVDAERGPGRAFGDDEGRAGGEQREVERELRERTQNTDIQVERRGDQIALTMPSSVTFSVDSAQLKPEFYQPLNEVAGTLVNYPSTAIDVVGHASADGPDDYNQQLSERRAYSVANYLQAQGVQPVRINAYGMGETQPIASNETQAGRAANRRVEILLNPVTQDQVS